jgi:hypothetical protein
MGYSLEIFDALKTPDLASETNIGVWIKTERVGKLELAKLNQKMDMLVTTEPGLAPKLLAGPIKSKKYPKQQSHIYKLIIHGDRMLRPMLCRGPIDTDKEYTMLLGAIEKNNVLDSDASEASSVRESILVNQRMRRAHERYK